MPVTTGLVLGGIGLAAKGIGAISANRNRKKAESALNELSSQPYAKYSISPEFASYYSKVLNNVNSPMGMTAAERAAGQQGINRVLNTQQYNVQGTSGGNLSRYISGALNNNALNASNQLAVTDSRLRQDNYNRNLGALGSAAGQFQNVDNMNTQQELNRRMMKEQALGQSVLQNKGYVTNTLNSLGSDLLGGGLMMGMGGMGSGGEGGVPFARVRNSFTPENTDYSVDPSILETNPLDNYRNTRSSLNSYFRK